MKVALFVMWDMSKTAEVAKVGDQTHTIGGRKVLAN